MIARINGTLLHKSVDHVVVDAHGIGYRIFVPLTTYYELPEEGSAVVLNIHTSVKQDGIHLFGFHADREKQIFQLMLSVNGIGPRLAMNILSGIAAEELIRAVSQGDLGMLVRIPGVGKKMAERMIVELKDKVGKLQSDGGDGGLAPIPDEDEQMTEDALSALMNLGYKRNAARTAIDAIRETMGEAATIDRVLKEALKILAG
ncbi:MAG: Holliday junction branch migration protein RuvA [Deltaproteobacteria bacterium]|nr:Holliday junction branch migration protein RuvA [Deltaproteobacteria bacterium]MBN2686828.1 Holliday junction branch migration protein RuvA [Deltaproteobacteria bacterium]